MPFRKLAAYPRKLAYILSATRDAQSCAKLLWYTARPRAWLASNRTTTKKTQFAINIRIGSEYDKNLHLRPLASDLTGLFDVLFDRCYFVPRPLLLPKNVDVIIDCGANVGLAALFFANRYRNAKIFCVEQNPQNYELLKLNTQTESRIIPINAAIVGRSTPTVRLRSKKTASADSQVADGTCTEVPALTISEICAQQGLHHIDLLKVDINGPEDIFAHAEFLPLVTLGMIKLDGNYTRRKFDIDLAAWGFVSSPPQPEAGLKMLTFRKKLELLR